MHLSCCRGGLSPAAASPQRLLKQPRRRLRLRRLLIGPSHRVEEEETSRESSSWEHTYMISASKWGRLLALIFVGKAKGICGFKRFCRCHTRVVPWAPWLILSSAECAGEARMNFFSAPRNPSAWQSEKKACSARKGDSDIYGWGGAPTSYVREAGQDSGELDKSRLRGFYTID